MNRPFQAVIFDFDYTLADSSPAVIECANTALRGMGLPPASDDAIRRTIGLSLPETLLRLAGEEHGNRTEEFRRLWRAKSVHVMVDGTTLLPGVKVAIDALKNRGLSLGIVSTKFHSPIQAVLGRENLLDKFDAIIGGDDVTQFKPDPQGLLLAIDRLGTQPGHTLYVGDNATDAETARRAGVPSRLFYQASRRGTSSKATRCWNFWRMSGGYRASSLVKLRETKPRRVQRVAGLSKLTASPINQGRSRTSF